MKKQVCAFLVILFLSNGYSGIFNPGSIEVGGGGSFSSNFIEHKPVLYAFAIGGGVSYFLSPHLFIDPELIISRIVQGDNSTSSKAIYGNLGYVFNTDEVVMPFLATGVGYWTGINKYANGYRSTDDGVIFPTLNLGTKIMFVQNVFLNLAGQYAVRNSNSTVNNFTVSFGISGKIHK